MQLLFEGGYYTGCGFYSNKYGNYIGVPEQALAWLPLGIGLVMEDEPSELSTTEVDPELQKLNTVDLDFFPSISMTAWDFK